VLGHIEDLPVVEENNHDLSALEDVRRGQRKSLAFITHHNIGYLGRIILNSGATRS